LSLFYRFPTVPLTSFASIFFLKVIVSAFIIFHLALITCWLFPNHPIEQAINSTFTNYIVFCGLDQGYGVFAPNPRSINVHLEAVITYADGTVRLWQYPRLERMNLWQKMIKERYRKYGNDNLAWTSDTRLLADLGRYVARLSSDQNHRAAMVSLIRYSIAMPLLPAGFCQSLPPQSDMNTLISYEVRPEDLE
jgi:hypothetical protein